ncbi:MAG: class B sortase [Eubacteriales bacterium]|nr:class B sortase [Eubacteriales bacterium]
MSDRQRHRRSYQEKLGRQKKHKKISGLMMVASLALFATAGILLARYIIMTKNTKTLQAELKESYKQVATVETEALKAPVSTPQAAPVVSYAPQNYVALQPSPTQEPAMAPEFLSLYKKNQDLVAWLKLEGIKEIDFPITQRDNSFYVSHDFLGRKSVAGTPFLDASCNVLPNSENMIIHAHNMKNGTMFGKLNHLLDEQTLKNHPLASFKTLYEDGTFVPFAVSIISIDPNNARYVPLVKSEFKSLQEREQYIERLIEFSSYSLPIDVLTQDELLTLVTCHGKEDSERLVVGYRRLRENESPEEIESYFKKNAKKIL